MSFVNALKSQLSEATQLTENGAVGYVTTGKAIVDMFFKVSSYRGMSDADVLADYTKVYAEDPNLAVKFAFYVGDIREGLGERRLFKLMVKFLADKENFDKLIKFVPEYNRFDSLFVLRGTELESKMVKYVHTQLKADAKADHPSLLAKWMPSVNTSSEKTKELARWFISKFNMTEREYRKLLSKIRKQLDVVEVKMCGNEWDKISYTGVPSKANINYKDAFLKHDEERRRAFLDKAVKGEVKMNSSTNFPHDIVHSYFEGGWCCRLKAKDDALEALWSNLKDTVKEAGANFIVVRDGSGSMTSTISGTTVSALDVATALSVYFAERQSGEFKNKFITFSSRPQLVDIGKGRNLHDKLQIVTAYDECSNTNIEATFDLVLKTAVANNMKQEEIPNLLIISDMEFDGATTNFGWHSDVSQQKTLFKHIADKFAAHGYTLPKLVFWNVCSRTGTIPMKQNDAGVGLVSGFSVNVVKAVLSDELDPYKVIVKTLNAPRYENIKV